MWLVTSSIGTVNLGTLSIEAMWFLPHFNRMHMLVGEKATHVGSCKSSYTSENVIIY